MTIGVVETFTSIPFYQTAKFGALAAGTQDGNAKVVVQGPAESTGSGEANIAQSLETSLQPQGFAPNPCVLPAWTQTLATLSRDIPNNNVATWNCKPIGAPGQKSTVTTFVGVDDTATGAAAAQYAIQAAHLSPSTTGTALVGECEKGVPILADRQKGAIAEIKKLLPKVTGVAFDSALDQSGNTASWTSEFGRYPKVVFAMGSCDQDSASLITLKTRGVGGNFAASTIDPNPQEIKAIQTGKFAAGVSTAPWTQANVVVRLLIAGARGTKLPVGWVDTGLHDINKADASKYLAAAESPAAAESFFTPLSLKVMSSLSTVTKPMEASLS